VFDASNFMVGGLNFKRMEARRKLLEVFIVVLHTSPLVKRENSPKAPSDQHPIATHFMSDEIQNSM